MTEFAYSQLMRWVDECNRLLGGGIQQLPILQNPSAQCRRLYQGGRVLDIGAGAHKPLQSRLGIPDSLYVSLDNDPDGDFTYGEADDIPLSAQFDFAMMNEVLEHLTVDDAAALEAAANRHMAPEALLVVTIPNVAHPVRQWSHALHVTAWPFPHLYGLLRHAGLNVIEVARYNKKPLARNPLKSFVVKTVLDTFRMDWCDSVMLMARKPGKDDDA